MPQGLVAGEAGTLGPAARRVVLPLYWLAWMLETLRAGREPGLLGPNINRSNYPYPWEGVALTCLVLAALTAVLYAILRPMTFARSWGRLGAATAFAFVLAIVSTLSFTTDGPGYSYVPGKFSLVTLALLLLGVVTLAIWPRSRERPATLRAPAP